MIIILLFVGYLLYFILSVRVQTWNLRPRGAGAPECHVPHCSYSVEAVTKNSKIKFYNFSKKRDLVDCTSKARDITSDQFFEDAFFYIL